jgi:hypothetical protein
MPWGKGNKMVARTMFPQGIGFIEEGNNFLGRRGGLTLEGKGLSCFGEQHDLKFFDP